MAGKIDDRLKELGIDLPTPPAPVASYVPFVKTGALVFISGQVPLKVDGTLTTGIVGDDVDHEAALEAARLCGINLIAQMKAATGGDLDRVVRVVKLIGFINASPGYGKQPLVINAASDLMVEVFGEIGRHARSAVGAGSLPFNVPVEIEATIEID